MNDDYKEIESELEKLLSDRGTSRINHIGSTAISGLWAKDIIDVLAEITESGNIENVAAILKQNMDEAAGGVPDYTKYHLDTIWHRPCPLT